MLVVFLADIDDRYEGKGPRLVFMTAHNAMIERRLRTFFGTSNHRDILINEMMVQPEQSRSSVANQ